EGSGRRAVKDPDKVRERFLRDALPMRLGALAADLARVASSALRDESGESVALMLEESQSFIEWTAAETVPEVAAELVDLQLQVALWRQGWQEAQVSRRLRVLLSVQARRWSDQVLGFSGLAP